MFSLLWDFAASLARGLTAASITLMMVLICTMAVLFTLVCAAPMKRLRMKTRGRPSSTRALLRRY